MVSITNHTCFIDNLQITMPKSQTVEHNPDTAGNGQDKDDLIVFLRKLFGNSYRVLPPRREEGYVNKKSPTTAEDIGGLIIL